MHTHTYTHPSGQCSVYFYTTGVVLQPALLKIFLTFLLLCLLSFLSLRLRDHISTRRILGPKVKELWFQTARLKASALGPVYKFGSSWFRSDSLYFRSNTPDQTREHFLPDKQDTGIMFYFMILLQLPGGPYLTDDWVTVSQICCLHVLGLFYYWLCFHKLHCLCCCVDIMNNFASGSQFMMVWKISHFKRGRPWIGMNCQVHLTRVG